MIRILTIILALATTRLTHAQDVWKEGTQWDVTYSEGGSESFLLSGHTEIDGRLYTNMFCNDKLIGYIRTERGDTVVYFMPTVLDLEGEYLLYDFGTFEPGTYVKYSVYDYATNGVKLRTDSIRADGMTYYHDVIYDGDILPCYNDIIFKLGSIAGPILFFMIDDYWSYGPNRRNVSHTVLKLTDDRTFEINVSGMKAVRITTGDGAVYSIQGIRTDPPQRGVYIKDGKKFNR